MNAEGYELHPGYGSVPRDGEYVERGEVLGLSVDASEVVIARASGRVRLMLEHDVNGRRLRAEIFPAAGTEIVTATFLTREAPLAVQVAKR